jgi:hypothetical protein
MFIVIVISKYICSFDNFYSVVCLKFILSVRIWDIGKRVILKVL